MRSMRRMLGLATSRLAICIPILAAHRAKHAAEPGDEAEHEPHEHQPRRGAELAIEKHPDQEPDDHRDAELETDRRGGQVAVRPPARSCDWVDDRHVLQMRVAPGQILRQIAAMPRRGLHQCGPWYHGEIASSIDEPAQYH